MRISDWSSDVCSSDLGDACGGERGFHIPVDDRPGVGIGVEVDDLRRGQPMFENFIFDAGIGERARCINAHGFHLACDQLHRGNAAIANAGGKGFAVRESSSRSEEHTSELQSLMRISYAVFCLNKNNKQTKTNKYNYKQNNKLK